MAVKLSSLKADLAREKKGDWVAYPEWPGVEFNVSSIHLPEYVAARAAMFQRLNVVHKSNIPQDVMTAEVGVLMNTHLLHGWRGFDIEYSPKAASEIMSDPAYREVIAAVQWCAGELGKIEVDFAGTETKNFEKPTGRG